MFDIGFTELVVIALVGLIVLGPKRLPEVARTAGQWLGRLRRFMTDVKQDLDRELQDAELTELRNLKHELDETRRTLEQSSNKLMQQVRAVPDEVTATAAAPSPAPDEIAAPAPTPTVPDEATLPAPAPTVPDQATVSAPAPSVPAPSAEGEPAPAPGGKRVRPRRRKPAAKRAHESSE